MGQPWDREPSPGTWSLILTFFHCTSFCSPPTSCLVLAVGSFWS